MYYEELKAGEFWIEEGKDNPIVNQKFCNGLGYSKSLLDGKVIVPQDKMKVCRVENVKASFDFDVVEGVKE